MLVLKRIGVGSAFKVGFVVNGLLALIFGLIAFLLQTALLSAVMSVVNVQTTTGAQTADALQAMSLVGTGTMCFLYAVSVVFGAVFGGIGFAVIAFCYNVAARAVGGLEIETIQTSGGLLDDIEAEIYEKRKRG